MKHIFICISLLLVSLALSSQSTITLNSARTTGGTEVACQTISLLPGFSFAAT